MVDVQTNNDLINALGVIPDANTTKALLKNIGISPNKSLGQNFLIDDSVASTIVGDLSLSENDVVVEIGPGTGALTRHLLGKVRRLILVEYDRKIASYLKEMLCNQQGVEILQQDATKFDLRQLFLEGEVKVIGSLPYSCGSEIIRQLLSPPTPITAAVFMLQKEVADRLCAKPKTKSYGRMTVMIGAEWKVKQLREISSEPFFPKPSVDSSVVKLTRRSADIFGPYNVRILRKLLSCGFAERRKQLKKRLPLGKVNWHELCEELDEKDTLRAEELTCEKWIQMARIIDSTPLKDNPQRDDEMFDVVDEGDQVVGQMARSMVHQEQRLHRAVHVFVFNESGELFLQKRSLYKDSSPGLWDSSVSGHLDVGESYREAASRELSEELGVDVVIEEVASIKAVETTGWEFVKLYRCEHGGPFNWPCSEIETGAFFPLELIDRWIEKRPQDFAQGFIECRDAFRGQNQDFY